MSYVVVAEDARCDRCGRGPNFNYQRKEFYLFKYVDEDHHTGEPIVKRLCRRCDWDIMNGRGGLFDDPSDVIFDHAWEDYEYDPLYFPRPSGGLIDE